MAVLSFWNCFACTGAASGETRPHSEQLQGKCWRCSESAKRKAGLSDPLTLFVPCEANHHGESIATASRRHTKSYGPTNADTHADARVCLMRHHGRAGDEEFFPAPRTLRISWRSCSSVTSREFSSARIFAVRWRGTVPAPALLEGCERPCVGESGRAEGGHHGEGRVRRGDAVL